MEFPLPRLLLLGRAESALADPTPAAISLPDALAEAAQRAPDLAQLQRRRLEVAALGETAARARFQTGAAPRLDVVQAALSRATVEADQAAREADRDAASAELAFLLGREPAQPLEAGALPP